MFRLRLFWLLPLFWVLGCSTARDREGAQDLTDSWSAKREVTLEHLMQSYKTGSIYLDYGTVLLVDAVYCDLTYRKLYLEELGEAYLHSSAHQLEQWKQEKVEYKNYYEFLLVLYSGSAKTPEFGRAGSSWQVLLRDDEGDLLKPVGTKMLSHKEREYLFLKKYLKPVDRWAEVYRVRFAKLNRPAPKGDHPFELLLTGIEGKTLLRWNDRTLFYQQEDPRSGL
ncbi:MAG: hypothetical protein RRB13_13775 [bacterium]|nr:hypothetical protein [bacterium]